MPRRLRVALVVVLVALLLAVATVAGLRAWRSSHRTELQQAMAVAPAGAERFSFTDWAGVRAELGADLDADSPVDGDAGLQAFLDDAFDRDLSSASAMVSSGPVLQEDLGFSPATAVWELFAQGDTGAAVVVRLPDDVDVDSLVEAWAAVGYARPDERATAGGVWRGGDDVLPALGGSLSPEFQYLAVDADAGVLVASDTADYAAVAERVVAGDGEAVEGLDDVVAAAGDALSASVYTGDNVCRALAMAQADESDQAEADALVAAAGDVDPLTGFAAAAQPGGDVLVAMGFASDEQARTNADTRATLASGPAVGQGGDFADRFRLRSTTAEDAVVVLDLDPLPDTFVLSDLASGPVLYATC